jgi:hypothetical protein
MPIQQISAYNAARDRNSPIKAHQINRQRPLIDRTINRFASASQLFWVCGRDRNPHCKVKRTPRLGSSSSVRSTSYSARSIADRSPRGSPIVGLETSHMTETLA